MATLLSAVTTDTTGTGASHSGDCTVWVTGTLDGATVVIQGAPTDANYVKLDRSILPQSRFSEPGACHVSGKGTHYLRAILENAGSNTNVTVTTTQ